MRLTIQRTVLLFLILSQSQLVSAQEELFTKPWKGDYDGMVEQRRMVRFLVVYSKTFYFVDKADQKGIGYELGKMFEEEINNDQKDKTLKINVVFVPVRRDELISALLEGRGDIAASNLTITPERLKEVDFSLPFLTDVSELIVTGPSAPPIKALDDLSGKEIYVRTSSSYYQSLKRLNESFRKVGKPLVKLTPADENLEDEDLLEMVNAGLITMVVVDSHKAQFWAQIFDKIVVHEDIAVRTGAEIAWAFRKDNPKLKKVVNDFVNRHRKGTMMGNILFKRYLRDTKWVKNSTTAEELKKFQQTVNFFKKYGGKYGFEYLMVGAQGYQESGLDQSVRSPVGAIGIMQILPSTARDPNVNIPNIENPEDNIHAGVKYMRFMMDEYFKDAQMDQVNKALFAFASYNAGPNKIARLRKQAAQMGLNPNVWFNNVELVVAKEIGRETVQYVSNIYKYYIAYKLIAEQRQLKEKAKGSVKQ
jgi:membrane-bound lytic murein transglycosylase MltF